MCCVELWCAVLYCVILYRIAYSVRESKSPAVSKNRKIRAKVDSRIYGRWTLQVMGSSASQLSGIGFITSCCLGEEPGRNIDQTQKSNRN